MHQVDDTLVQRSHIYGDAVVINQCDTDAYAQYPTRDGLARMFSTTQRGLTKSRNMAIRNSDADICLLSDDDEVFAPGYVKKIVEAYESLPQADVIIFKIDRVPPEGLDGGRIAGCIRECGGRRGVWCCSAVPYRISGNRCRQNWEKQTTGRFADLICP